MRTRSVDRSVLLAAALVAASSLAAAPRAHADAGEGAIRLGADVSVLGFQHFPGDFGDLFAFQFGLLAEEVTRPQVAASFAYQLTNDLLIGVRGGFGVALVEAGGFSATRGVVSLVPFFECMFGQGNLRPFIGAEAGFQLLFPDMGDAQGWFVGGPMGGVHIFATQSFTISPMAVFDFFYRGDVERAGYGLTGLVSFAGWIN